TGVKDLAGNPLDRAYNIDLFVGEALYPGDANNDGKVDETDLLPIGLYFGEQGPNRDSAIGLAWQLAPVHITLGGNSWSPADAAWADADGSGTVDADDICGLALNWGKNHTPLSPGIRDSEVGQALAGLDDSVLRQMRQALAACPNGQGSRGLMDMLDELVSGGSSDPDAVLPERVELYQNYPNPFNPETVIQFALPQAQRVNLTIFNIMGQQVKVLLNKTAPAGFNEVTWDGSDRSGNDVASGIYFYRLTTGNSTITRRMTLTK
ncbi:MAG: T9SS type A sorting domain-containing protein, partial [Candidatus Zixiibacteriota bacterium]